jgi:hypothetical protein
LLFTTVRIETASEAHRGVGTRVRVPRANESGAVLALVTNKHVIDGANQRRFALTKDAGSNEPSLGDTHPVVLSDPQSSLLGILIRRLTFRLHRSSQSWQTWSAEASARSSGQSIPV